MKKLSFSKSQVKLKTGLPKNLKIIAASALIMGTLQACPASDDCRTTSTDTGSSADLGAQQDPISLCDSD